MYVRLCRCLAVSLSGLLAVSIAPPMALARPTVTMTASAVHLPGAPGAGGPSVGVAVQARYVIRGAEVDGQLPSPLEGIDLSLPRGAVLHPGGFGVCPATTLERRGPRACPVGSRAGGVGSVESSAALGPEVIREPATLQAFFAPGGGLEFGAVGSTPVSFKLMLATGHFVRRASSFGPTLTTALRPITTLPGASDASITAISLGLGVIFKKKGGDALSYVDLPRGCPRAGYSVKSELTFQDGERVTVAARAPCPKR